jgi:hypothetical protein
MFVQGMLSHRATLERAAVDHSITVLDFANHSKTGWFASKKNPKNTPAQNFPLALVRECLGIFDSSMRILSSHSF